MLSNKTLVKIATYKGGFSRTAHGETYDYYTDGLHNYTAVPGMEPTWHIEKDRRPYRIFDRESIFKAKGKKTLVAEDEYVEYYNYEINPKDPEYNIDGFALEMYVCCFKED